MSRTNEPKHKQSWKYQFKSLEYAPTDEVKEELRKIKHTRYIQRGKELSNFIEVTKMKSSDTNYLYFPHWVMDSFKQAVEQFTIGHFFSSVILCGAIIEFISIALFEKYERLNEVDRKGLGKNLTNDKYLQRLFDKQKITKDLMEKLRSIYQKRNDYTHLKIIKGTEEEKGQLEYDKRIREDSINVLGQLIKSFEILADEKQFENL